MLKTAPPEYPVVFIVDRDVINGRFVKAITHEDRPGCEIRYSGNLGAYEYLNGNIRKLFADSVFPESEREIATKLAKES